MEERSYYDSFWHRQPGSFHCLQMTVFTYNIKEYDNFGGHRVALAYITGFHDIFSSGMQKPYAIELALVLVEDGKWCI